MENIQPTLPRLTHVSAILREYVADFSNRPVAVVGNSFHDHRDAARPIAFVRHFVELSAFQFPCAFHDCPLDVVGRHVQRFRVADSLAQASVGILISTADTSGNRDFLDDLREGATALRVGGSFLMFNTVPLRMARHNLSLITQNRLQFNRG